MNRQIKFRAWDKTQNKMVSGYEAFKNGVCGWQNDDTGSHIILREDKYELMQSTGIKDKNCVEIFEGDIIRIKNYTTKRPLVVYYSNGGFRIRHGTFFDRLTYIADCNITVEIIANKFENPELLK
jgi:uncharacterized phage protein (TIGR01671 family)